MAIHVKVDGTITVDTVEETFRLVGILAAGDKDAVYYVEQVDTGPVTWGSNSFVDSATFQAPESTPSTAPGDVKEPAAHQHGGMENGEQGTECG